jgi:hypothetical protein
MSWSRDELYRSREREHTQKRFVKFKYLPTQNVALFGNRAVREAIGSIKKCKERAWLSD